MCQTFDVTGRKFFGEELNEALKSPTRSLVIATTMAPFGCADKPAEKHCWLICCERKILFQLKK
jgi:hypothetical protein